VAVRHEHVVSRSAGRGVESGRTDPRGLVHGLLPSACVWCWHHVRRRQKVRSGLGPGRTRWCHQGVSRARRRSSGAMVVVPTPLTEAR
jgi:hypothetical protein